MVFDILVPMDRVRYGVQTNRIRHEDAPSGSWQRSASQDIRGYCRENVYYSGAVSPSNVSRWGASPPLPPMPSIVMTMVRTASSMAATPSSIVPRSPSVRDEERRI